jgi:hypothetical protein
MKTIPTEPIGSIPQPLASIEGWRAFLADQIAQAELGAIEDL